MDRNGYDACVALEDTGHPVSLMDVAIEGQRPRDRAAGLKRADGDRDVVKGREAGAALRPGVMRAAGGVAGDPRIRAPSRPRAPSPPRRVARAGSRAPSAADRSAGSPRRSASIRERRRGSRSPDHARARICAALNRLPARHSRPARSKPLRSISASRRYPYFDIGKRWFAPQRRLVFWVMDYRRRHAIMPSDYATRRARDRADRRL